MTGQGPGSGRGAAMVLLFAIVAAVASCGSEPTAPPVRGTAPVAVGAGETGTPRAAPLPSERAVPRRDEASGRDLGSDERRGGHTLARHVGRTDEELRARLLEESIAAASTWTDRATAERIVQETLTQSRGRVEAWGNRHGSRPNLALSFRGDRRTPIGRTLRRGARAAQPAFNAVVVLRWDQRRGDYYVLTSYPEDRR